MKEKLNKLTDRNENVDLKETQVRDMRLIREGG